MSRKTAERLLHNEVCTPAAIDATTRELTFSRVLPSASRLLCAIDGTSLLITDRVNRKGLGKVGSHDSSTGLIVQSSVLLDEGKVPIGIVRQRYWSRPADCVESEIWREGLLETDSDLAKHGLADKTTILMDRGYDCSALLSLLKTLRSRVIIRAVQDRLVCPSDTPDMRKAKKLAVTVGNYLQGVPFSSSITIDVCAATIICKGQKTSVSSEKRECHLQIKSAKVGVLLHNESQPEQDRAQTSSSSPKARYSMTTATVVYAEESAPPDGSDPMKAMFWLNYDVDSPDELAQVIADYKARWRIEEFHKMWKTGGVNAEETQVQDRDALECVLRTAAVAGMRLLEMRYRLGANPAEDASSCFTQEEIKGFDVIDQADYRGRTAKKHKPN
jgi:hypothetical protein